MDTAYKNTYTSICISKHLNIFIVMLVTGNGGGCGDGVGEGGDGSSIVADGCMDRYVYSFFTYTALTAADR